jgi:hypothetical protein
MNTGDTAAPLDGRTQLLITGVAVGAEDFLQIAVAVPAGRLLDIIGVYQ